MSKTSQRNRETETQIGNGISSKTEGWTQGFTNKRKSLKESCGMVSFVLIIQKTDTVEDSTELIAWQILDYALYCFSCSLCIPMLYWCLQIQSHSTTVLFS